MATRPVLRDPRLFRSLHYFESVARHGSVSLAAAEIGVSASAVSHQLRELATTLGEELVVKSGRGIILTPAGRRLSDRLAEAFSELDSIITDVVGGTTQVLRLAVCSSFGPAWLTPRLPDFARSNPGINVELRLYSHDPEQTHAVADAFVTALPIKPGFKSVPLFEEMLVAVQKPVTGGFRINGPNRLITTDVADEELGKDWDDYFSTSGIQRATFNSREFVRCTHYLLALELAKAGMGVALVPDFLAAESLASGNLAYFDRTRVPAGRTYRLCYKEARADDPLVRSLARWMKAQVGGSVVPFAPHGRAMP